MIGIGIASVIHQTTTNARTASRRCCSAARSNGKTRTRPGTIGPRNRPTVAGCARSASQASAAVGMPIVERCESPALSDDSGSLSQGPLPPPVRRLRVGIATAGGADSNPPSFCGAPGPEPGFISFGDRARAMLRVTRPDRLRTCVQRLRRRISERSRAIAQRSPCSQRPNRTWMSRENRTTGLGRSRSSSTPTRCPVSQRERQPRGAGVAVSPLRLPRDDRLYRAVPDTFAPIA